MNRKYPSDFINKLTKPSEIVLDPFIGSGTTALSCIKTGRNFIGIDISEEYCKVALNRIDNK